MRKAVIDMGTNTFHLMVVEYDAQGQWRPLFRHRVFVKLAEAGLHHISEAAFERALRALDDFRMQLEAVGINPETVPAFGTAALRSADNAGEFLERARIQTGIQGRVITGDEEAKLIYLGVRQAVPWPETECVLIMDIGGGSVEFILADRQQVYWQHSFNVGVAVLHRRFHKHDPIHPEEIAGVEHFLETSLQPLWDALQTCPVHYLVGAAGAFDTIDLFALDPVLKPPLYGELPASDFEPVFDLFVNSTREERLTMPLLMPERQEMIVAAVVLIRYIIRRAGIRSIYTSVYSLKEGMLEATL